jgi:hypothetical protein
MDADTTQRIQYGPRFLRALGDEALLTALCDAGVRPTVTYAPVDEHGRIGLEPPPSDAPRG